MPSLLRAKAIILADFLDLRFRQTPYLGVRETGGRPVTTGDLMG